MQTCQLIKKSEVVYLCTISPYILAMGHFFNLLIFQNLSGYQRGYWDRGTGLSVAAIGCCLTEALTSLPRRRWRPLALTHVIMADQFHSCSARHFRDGPLHVAVVHSKEKKKKKRSPTDSHPCPVTSWTKKIGHITLLFFSALALALSDVVPHLNTFSGNMPQFCFVVYGFTSRSSASRCLSELGRNSVLEVTAQAQTLEWRDRHILRNIHTFLPLLLASLHDMQHHLACGFLRAHPPYCEHV